jgi:hypothetical protein
MRKQPDTPLPLHAQRLVHALADHGWDFICTRTPEDQGPATVTVTGNKGMKSTLVVWKLPWPGCYRLLSCHMSDGQSAVRDANLSAVQAWVEVAT